MFCPNCGFPYGPDDRFCGRCGAALPTGAEAAAPPPEPLPEEPASPPPRRKRRLRYLLPVVLVLAAAAGALAFFLTRPAPLDRSYGLHSTPSLFFLTEENRSQIALWRGTEQLLTFPAEDGFFRSSASAAGGSPLLVTGTDGILHRADSQSCTTLAEQVLSCFLSGDGSTAAWVTEDQALWLQRGEEAPVLVDESVSPYSVLVSFTGRALVWQTDYSIEGAPRCYLSLDGGAPRDLELDGIAPALVTDSGTLYYTTMQGSSFNLYTWRDGVSTLLTDRLSSPGCTLFFNRDGTELLYKTAEDDITSTWFCREGEEPKKLGDFFLRLLCFPSCAYQQFSSTAHLSVYQYDVATLREKALRTDQNIWLLDRDGNASPLFPEGSVVSLSYVSQDGNSLVTQVGGSGDQYTLYRFDDLWGSPESQVLAQGRGLRLSAPSADLSVLCYSTYGENESSHMYYVIREGSEPECFTEGNESVLMFPDGRFLYSTDDGTRFFLSDGSGDPIPVDMPQTDEDTNTLTFWSIGQQQFAVLYDFNTSLQDVYALSPNGSVTLLSENVGNMFNY